MMADMVTVFMNSARKNRANRIEEYSVWNPPTISCSASTRSNGGRFSSAVPAMRNTMNGTKPVTMRFQFGMNSPKPAPAWTWTMRLVLSEPETSSTDARDRPEGRLVGDGLGRWPGPSRAAGTSNPTTNRPA